MKARDMSELYDLFSCHQSTFHYTQAEQDLKDELEVKLTVTSLVCSVTERDSDQRLVDRTAENSHTEALHETKTTVREDDLRAEFDSISALVNKVQIDLAAATGDQKQAIHDLKTDLVGRINELEAMAEVWRFQIYAVVVSADNASPDELWISVTNTQRTLNLLATFHVDYVHAIS